MPLYEYRCEDCGKISEVIQKFSDDPLTKCTDCGGELHRLLSAPAIRFKGSGWYVSDYARKNVQGDGDSTDETSPTKEPKTGSKEKGTEKASAKKDAKNNTAK